MPYAPGIQDISGQLIAQGMSQAGAARARAIESLGESISGGIKQYQQNQLFTQQALGKFGQQLQDPTFKKYVDQVVNDDPNAPQVPDALKKAFKNAAAGKVDIYDAALLGTATEGYQQNKLRQAQVQGMISEDALRKAQADKLQMEVSRMREENEFFKRLEAGMPAAQPAMQPAPQPSPAPAQIPYFLRRDVSGVPAEAIQAVAPQAAAAAPAAQAVGQAAALPFAGAQRPSGVITPQDIAEARRELGPGANLAQIRMTATKNVEARAKEFVPEGLFSTDQAARQRAKELDTSDPIPGSVREVEYVPQAKAFTIKPIPRAKTAEEEIALEGRKAGVKSLVDRASAQKTADIGEAGRNRMVMPAVIGLTKLYAEGGLEGGALAENFAQARSFLKSLNVPVDEAALGNAQLAKGYIGQLILPYFNQFKGSMSNNDVKLIQSWNPSLATDPKVGLEMMKALDARITLGRKLETLANQADATEMSDKQYVAKRQEILNEYDASIESPAAIIESAAKKQAARVGGQTGGQNITRIRVYGQDF